MANPSINTDAGDKAAGAGYVKLSRHYVRLHRLDNSACYC